MAIIISIGKWGGVYLYRGFGFRIALGWIAITYFPVDGDRIINYALKYSKEIINNDCDK